MDALSALRRGFNYFLLLLNDEGFQTRYRKVINYATQHFGTLFGEKFFRELMLVPTFRYLYQAARCVHYVEEQQALRMINEDSGDICKGTVEHNLAALRSLDNLALLPRNLMLVRPLSIIQTINPDSARVLVVGPRTEDDLLCLHGHGFRPEHVRGLDLISYSPWIDLGDMHHMPYPDNSWDAVMAGWVMPYSNNPKALAHEITRVLRPGGIAAIGFEYVPPGELGKNKNVIVGEGAHVNSVMDLLELFGESLEYVYFSHDITRLKPSEKSELVAVFSVQK